MGEPNWKVEPSAPLYITGVSPSKRQAARLKQMFKAIHKLKGYLHDSGKFGAEAIEYLREVRNHSYKGMFSIRTVDCVSNYYLWNVQSRSKPFDPHEKPFPSACFPRTAWRQQKTDPTKFKIQGLQGWLKIPVPKDFDALKWHYLIIYGPYQGQQWRAVFKKTKIQRVKDEFNATLEPTNYRNPLPQDVRISARPWGVNCKSEVDEL